MQLPIDEQVVDECRALAARVADGVQRFIDEHTTASIERTVLRAYGADGANPEGVPIVNSAVERYREAGLIGRGIAFFLGRALAAGASTPAEAVEELAYGAVLDDGTGGPDQAAVRAALEPHTRAALARIDDAREARLAAREKL